VRSTQSVGTAIISLEQGRARRDRMSPFAARNANRQASTPKSAAGSSQPVFLEAARSPSRASRAVTSSGQGKALKTGGPLTVQPLFRRCGSQSGAASLAGILPRVGICVQYKSVRVALPHDDGDFSFDLIIDELNRATKRVPTVGWWGKLRSNDLLPFILRTDGKMDFGALPISEITELVGRGPAAEFPA
jgi:hypothetical protein